MKAGLQGSWHLNQMWLVFVFAQSTNMLPLKCITCTVWHINICSSGAFAARTHTQTPSDSLAALDTTSKALIVLLDPQNANTAGAEPVLIISNSASRVVKDFFIGEL